MFKATVIILYILTLSSPGFGLGQPDSVETENPAPATTSSQVEQRSKVTGSIRLVGNEPFTRLVLTAEEGKNYYLKPEKLPVLTDLQMKRVELTGQLSSKAIYAANGKFITTEYTIVPEIITYHDILRGIFKLMKTKEGPDGSLLVNLRNNARKYSLQLAQEQNYEVYQDKQVEVSGAITIRLHFNEQESLETATFTLSPQAIRRLD